MTQERFIKLLENPDLLASIPYEELKTLTLTYPYAHNLRYLLVLKARQDKHPDFARNLTAAAAYSLDRSRLFQLAAPKTLVPQPVPVEPELVLELKPIETLQRELQARAPVVVAEEAAAVAMPVQQSEAAAKVNLNDAAYGDTGGPDFVEPHVPEHTALEEPAQEAPPEAQVDSPPATPIAAAKSFYWWVNQFNAPALAESPPGEKSAEAVRTEPEKQVPEPVKAPKTPAEPPKGTMAQQLAEKSVTENKEIVSETLAQLYARQGYRDKAIAMYERLCLKFPEKSPFFAAEIEKLKK